MLPSDKDMFNGNNKIEDLIRVDGDYVFREGELFDSYDELLQKMELHTKESLVYYWRRDSRTVQKAFTKTSRPIAPKLKYYFVRFACIYGGMKFQTRGSGIRVSQTMRTDCQAHILLRASKCGTKLEVISVCNDHNHEISEKVSQMLPQNRRLPDALKEEVLEMLRLKIDRKKIIEYVKQRENKKITSKDLFNLAARLKSTEIRPEEFERRNKILEKINCYTTEKSIKSIVSSELAASEEQEQYYSVEDEEITEYISPDHSFVVNETIIGSMVDAKNRNYTEWNLESEDDSSKQKSDIKTENFIIKQNDFNDFQFEEQKILDDIIIDESETFEKISRNKQSSPIIIYEDFIGEDEACYLSAIDEETKDLSLEDNVDSPETTMNNGSIVLFETITDSVITEDPEQSEHYEETNQEMNTKKRVQKSRMRILKCRKCGTDARLLKSQINYLRAKKTKLRMETKLLNLERLKLLTEIKNITR